MSDTGTTETTSSGEDVCQHATDFPKFPDGDVLVVSSTGRVWKLHSSTLKNASTVFRGILEAAEAIRPVKRRKENPDANWFRWKIHMVEWEEEPRETRLRTFKLVDSTAKQPSYLPQTMNGTSLQDPPYNKIYDNVFRCLYNLDPRFTPSAESIDYFILDATSVLKAAEYIGAGPAIRVIVEAHFLRLDQKLWKHVAKNSAAWTDIALRLQSPTIFRAAMAHVAGRFHLQGKDGVDKNFLAGQPNGKLLMEIAERKADELKDMKLRVERLALDYFPAKMYHPEENNIIPGREAYGNDIYLWQALVLVRQFLASAMMSNMHHRANDGGTDFYYRLDAGGEHYLARGVLERFHEKFAMSTKGKECLRTALALVKGKMKEIVSPLLVDGSHIRRRPSDCHPRYLTCSEIDDEELPWIAGKVNCDDDN